MGGKYIFFWKIIFIECLALKQLSDISPEVRDYQQCVIVYKRN